MAEIDQRVPAAGGVGHAGGGPAGHGDQVAVHAGEADAAGAVALERAQDFDIRAARVDHLGHFERVVVRHAAARDLLDAVAQAGGQRVGLRAAPMHDDDMEARAGHRRQIRGQRVQARRVAHDLAAELDDKPAPMEPGRQGGIVRGGAI